MNLRPYQQQAIDALFKWWEAGRQGEDPLIWLPTAAGKTVIFSHLIKRLMNDYKGVTVLILAHRKELLTQAEQKLLAVWPEAPVGVYAASLDRREIRPITIASRDTLAGVLEEVGQFTFVIIDECHRMNAKEGGRYQTIVRQLRAQYPDLVVVGFTATPYRLGQGKIYGEGKPFADIAYKKPMLEMIQEGYLCPLTSRTAERGEIDTTGIATRGGDFDEAQLSERASDSELVREALTEWQTLAADRKHSVFFCVSILHAGIVSEQLHRMGIDAPVITGETAGSERDHLLHDFNEGQFRAIVNVGVLTEGWDAPLVDCIVLLRPTKSASLYVQMVGRGLRLHPSKSHCLILDFGGNIQRLGPVDQAGEREPKEGKKKKGATERPYKRCGTWNEEETCWEKGCGHKNATAAAKCAECGQPFFNHNAQAQQGGITTAESDIQWFEVERMSYRVMTSTQTGKEYLRIAYHCGLFETFYENLMLGYEGHAGKKALSRLGNLVNEGVYGIPSAYVARELLDAGDLSFKAVKSIAVNLSDKWKPVVETRFSPLTHPRMLRPYQVRWDDTVKWQEFADGTRLLRHERNGEFMSYLSQNRERLSRF